MFRGLHRLVKVCFDGVGVNRGIGIDRQVKRLPYYSSLSHHALESVDSLSSTALCTINERIGRQ